VDNDPLTATLVTPPLHGTLTLNPNGSFTYTPSANYFGGDSFVYRLFDGLTTSNNASVFITIASQNDLPVLFNLNVTNILENGIATLSGNISDNDLTDAHFLSINWGDGSPVDNVTVPAGQTFFSIQRLFLDDNPTATPSDTYQVVVSMTDNNSGFTSGSASLTVSNVPPDLFNVTLTHSITVGNQAILQGQFADPGTRDTYQLVVEWGDGDIITYNYGQGVRAFNEAHIYLIPGNYSPLVTLIDDDLGQDQVVATIGVSNASNLSILKTVNPDPASVGEDITYNIIILNGGPDPATNVTVIDTLPFNLPVVRTDIPYTVVNGSLIFNLGDFAVGERKAFNVICRTQQPGPITNVASVTSDQIDVDTANNLASVTSIVGELSGADLTGAFTFATPLCKLSENQSMKCKLKAKFTEINRGDTATGIHFTRMYVSDDPFYGTTDTLVLTKLIKKLAPLKTKKLNLLVKIPEGVSSTGKYLICVVDQGNQVFEGNETNNFVVAGPLP